MGQRLPDTSPDRLARTDDNIRAYARADSLARTDDNIRAYADIGSDHPQTFACSDIASNARAQRDIQPNSSSS